MIESLQNTYKGQNRKINKDYSQKDCVPRNHIYQLLKVYKPTNGPTKKIFIKAKKIQSKKMKKIQKITCKKKKKSYKKTENQQKITNSVTCLKNRNKFGNLKIKYKEVGKISINTTSWTITD